MSEKSFIIDFKCTKQDSLYDLALVLIGEVMGDVDQKRMKKQKFETIRQIILDATECEEDI